MLMERVLETAKQYIEGTRIQDAVIGLSLIALELDNGNVGISYVLREGLPAGCSVFPYAQELVGQSAWEVAQWVLTGSENVQRAIGVAVLTAASRSQPLEDVDEGNMPFGIKFLPTDRVGMVGYVKAVADRIEGLAKELVIFDEGQYLRGGYTTRIHQRGEQGRLLPLCDLIILSGTTVINNTVDGLLALGENAREIILLGPSTPMYPQAFTNTKVTVLAGSWWNSQAKNSIFKSVSLACGISHLSKHAIKKAVAVKERKVFPG